MQEAASATTAAAAATAAPGMEEDTEERFVKVGSRFFRVTKARDGGPAMARRLRYLESCFLCKKTIDCDRDIFMYKGDAAFCSEDCRDNQMDMDEALHAVARRSRLLRKPPSTSQQAAGAVLGEESSGPPVMRRRPTIANLAARNPPVVAS